MNKQDQEVKLYIEKEIRPLVQSDGGNIEVKDVSDGTVELLINGQCATCPAANKHLVVWLGEQLETEFNRPFTIKPETVVAYFWR